MDQQAHHKFSMAARIACSVATRACAAPLRDPSETSTMAPPLPLLARATLASTDADADDTDTSDEATGDWRVCPTCCRCCCCVCARRAPRPAAAEGESCRACADCECHSRFAKILKCAAAAAGSGGSGDAIAAGVAADAAGATTGERARTIGVVADTNGDGTVAGVDVRCNECTVRSIETDSAAAAAGDAAGDTAGAAAVAAVVDATGDATALTAGEEAAVRLTVAPAAPIFDAPDRFKRAIKLADTGAVGDAAAAIDTDDAGE